MKIFRFIPISSRRVPSRRQVAKAVRRWWLQVTAPKWAREVWLKNRKKKPVRVCDMNDGHLLNTIVYLKKEAVVRAWFMAPPSWYEHDFPPYEPEPTPRPILNVMVREASRRGLRSALAEIEAGRLPKWLEESNAAFGARERERQASKPIDIKKIDDKRAKKRAAEVVRTVIGGRYPG